MTIPGIDIIFLTLRLSYLEYLQPVQRIRPPALRILSSTEDIEDAQGAS